MNDGITNMTTQDIPANLRAALDKPGAKLERAFMVQREAVNVEARTAMLAFASETPYERYWGLEILDCAAPTMRLGRIGSGANLLVAISVTILPFVRKSIACP